MIFFHQSTIGFSSELPGRGDCSSTLSPPSSLAKILSTIQRGLPKPHQITITCSSPSSPPTSGDPIFRSNGVQELFRSSLVTDPLQVPSGIHPSTCVTRFVRLECSNLTADTANYPVKKAATLIAMIDALKHQEVKEKLHFVWRVSSLSVPNTLDAVVKSPTS